MIRGVFVDGKIFLRVFQKSLLPCSVPMGNRPEKGLDDVQVQAADGAQSLLA